MEPDAIRLGVVLSHVGHLVGPRQERLLDLARMVDDAGIDQIVLTDHVVLGTKLDAHAALGGPFPYPSDEPYPEPLVTLAAIAAVTTRVRLSTGVLIAPLRPAVLLAKLAATVDAISRGRLDLGVGTGWQAEEFDALGVPLEGKAQRLDDTIRACQALWTQQPASFSSATVSFEDLYCSPGPWRPEGIPVWFGGTANHATARRIAELGEGWLPMGLPPGEGLERGVAMLRAEFERVGRDPSTIGVRVMLPIARDASEKLDVERTRASVQELRQRGVTIVTVSIGSLAREMAEVPSLLEAARALVRE
jgi:probable F420-dependent oxidoreductase